MNVGAECESKKEGEAGAKPHHKRHLHCVTHNFIKFHGVHHSVCLPEAEPVTTESYITVTSCTPSLY